jgi:hypothetical protein
VTPEGLSQRHASLAAWRRGVFALSFAGSELQRAGIQSKNAKAKGRYTEQAMQVLGALDVFEQ